MSLTEVERQALGSIEHGLTGSDPRLAAMLNIFSRLASGEEMPVREKLRVRRGRPAARRPRRARRHPRRSTARPQARPVYRRLSLPQAMVLLWVVISVGLIAIALIVNSGHNTCIRSMGVGCTAAPSHSVPTVAPVQPSGDSQEHLRVTPAPKA